MRKAITTLQSAARLKADDEILKSDIYEIAGVSILRAMTDMLHEILILILS